MNFGGLRYNNSNREHMEFEEEVERGKGGK